jgi:hypothetical protein
MKNNFCFHLCAGILLTTHFLPAQEEANASSLENRLLNGGFESGEPADFGTLKDWEVQGSIGALPIGFTKTKIGFAPSYIPKKGRRMAILSAGNNDFGGSISQTFDTVPGVSYVVNLAVGVASEAMGRKQALQVAVTDGDGAFILSRIEIIVSLGKGTTWREFSAKFIAAGNRSRINIQDLSEILQPAETSNTDLIFDEVSVVGMKTSQVISNARK